MIKEIFDYDICFLEKSFAGMKKGFLNSGGGGSSSSTTSKSQSTELIEISRKRPEQTKDFRVFDEVQQVMKEEEQSKSSIKNLSHPFFS